MKAIVYEKYGPPEVLQLKEVEKPVPRDHEVLVKVYAASINSWDWDLVRGKPVFFRFWGLFKPKYQIPGADIAGRVEAVGDKVTLLQPGDEVFGDLCACGWGGFAEYVCVPENVLAMKPAGMTYEQAAAIPQAAVMAIQGIRDYGRVKPEQTVLINGAGGGVGTFALQMAKYFGAEVTGVDSTRKLETMRSIGADRVIDYTREDFTKNRQLYHLILDVAAYHSIFDYMHALYPGGKAVIVGGSPARIFQTLIMGPFISMAGTKKVRILAHKPNRDLAFLNELFEAGKIKPVIDRRYTLGEVPEAFRYFGKGHTRGKIVITV